MIGIIGIKRVIILLILIVVNASMGAALYLYMIPEKENLDREQRGLRAQLSSVQSDIDRMQLEFEQLDQQQSKFDALKADGFFSTQVRSSAKDLLSEIQRESRVISAVVSVKSGILEDNVEAAKSGHKVLMSPIEVEISAFDDADVYSYLEIAERRFPGHLRVDGLEIQRTRDMSAAVLRAIASGANPELIRASIRMSWRTMIPESQVIAKP
ncbi:MAG: hypothetical protein ACRBDL_09855 [Alphaproteobacteria bacterium]